MHFALVFLLALNSHTAITTIDRGIGIDPDGGTHQAVPTDDTGTCIDPNGVHCVNGRLSVADTDGRSIIDPIGGRARVADGDTGSCVDPNGVHIPCQRVAEGPIIDPNGTQRVADDDTGTCVDPNGAHITGCIRSAEGTTTDPTGRPIAPVIHVAAKKPILRNGSCIDPDGRCHPLA